MMHNRDPFAREELHSERVYEPGQPCDWCGQLRQTKSGRPWLYRFRVEPDAGRTFRDHKLFCSRECRPAYFSSGILVAS